MGYIKGFTYCCLWFCSIAAGYALLFCPLFPLLLISNRAYRYISDLVFTFWQLYPTALLHVLCDCRLVITGDSLQPGTTSVLVMNHRTRTDWNFLWPAAYHSVGPGTGILQRFTFPLKFVLKDAIRHIPGPGWVMQLACFAYIKRSWIIDQHRLEDLIDYYTRINYKYTMVLFPEGTDLTPNTKTGSHHYADKNQLQKYNYVLHPRTTGFTYLTKKLLETNSLDSIHDVTLLYPDVIPQQEVQLIKGHFPKVVRMHFQRYDKKILPRTEIELRKFLEVLWQKKEQSLSDYYTTGTFLEGPKLLRHSKREFYTALIFWTVLPFVAGYLFLVNSVFQTIVVSHTLLLLFLNIVTGGFQQFEIWVYKVKCKVWNNPW